VGLVSALFVVPFVLVVGLALWLLFGSRRRFLRSLGPVAAQGLARILRSSFDEAPKSRVESNGMVAVVEARRNGTAIEVRSSFADSARYLSTGYRDSSPSSSRCVSQRSSANASSP
jgi:hypothetical protein